MLTNYSFNVNNERIDERRKEGMPARRRNDVYAQTPA